MYWKKGTSRVVLVIPALGICFKFARVRLWNAVIGTRDSFRIGGGRLAKRYWQYPIREGKASYGARSDLYRGILDNWHEWRFSSRSRPVLARTYLTLGFVNVQEMVEPNPIPFATHYRRFERVVGWLTLNNSNDSHAFSHHNFGVRDGKAVVVDYGSPSMQEVLLEFGDRIHAELDLVTPP